MGLFNLLFESRDPFPLNRLYPASNIKKLYFQRYVSQAKFRESSQFRTSLKRL